MFIVVIPSSLEHVIFEPSFLSPSRLSSPPSARFSERIMSEEAFKRALEVAVVLKEM